MPHHSRLSHWRSGVIVVLCMLMLASCASAPPTNTAILTGCGIPLQLTIRATPAERALGYTGVRDIPDGTGMVFLWPEPTAVSFWMKDTPLPLEVVFFDEQYVILDIVAMQSNDETIHAAPQPVSVAVEVPQGHFARYGVMIGDQCTLELPADIEIVE